MEAIRPVLEAVFAYLKEHPEELLRALRKVLALRFGLPLDALRWIAGRTNGSGTARHVEIAAVPPGVRLGASFDLMNTPLRASADIFVERIAVASDKLLFEVRLANVKLNVEDPTVESPLAALLRSGALDLSKPGNLVHYMPKRPPLLVEARDDRIVIDLLLHEKFAKSRSFKRWVGRITPLLTLHAIETDSSHLDVALRAFPDGLDSAFENLRRAAESVLRPS